MPSPIGPSNFILDVSKRFFDSLGVVVVIFAPILEAGPHGVNGTVSEPGILFLYLIQTMT
jgi:hypothetical protein